MPTLADVIEPGFVPGSLSPGPVSGFGLFSIQQRLPHMGGNLEIESSPAWRKRTNIKISGVERRCAIPGIFISYRREDCPGHAGRIFDHLRTQFGSGTIFMDVSTLEAGVDFVKEIHRAVGSCDALLAIIGPKWLNCTDQAGHRRLDNSNDFIRLEISGALTREVRVIPVLVEGAAMPGTQDLPADLEALTHRQALELRDARWDADMEELIVVCERVLSRTQKESGLPAKHQAISGVPIQPGMRDSRPAKPASRLLAGIAALILLASAGIYFGLRAYNDSKRNEGGTVAGGTKAPDAQRQPGPPPNTAGGGRAGDVNAKKPENPRSGARSAIESGNTPLTTASQTAASNVPAGHPAGSPAGAVQEVPRSDRLGSGSSVRSGETRQITIPDVTRLNLRLAARELENAGVSHQVRLVQDMKEEPGTVLAQERVSGTAPGKPQLVVLITAASGIVVIHYLSGDQARGEALAAFLRTRGSAGGFIVRATQQPMLRKSGAVSYGDAKLEFTAANIAKDAGDWLSNGAGRSVSLRTIRDTSVVGRTLIIGLPPPGR